MSLNQLVKINLLLFLFIDKFGFIPQKIPFPSSYFILN